MILVLMGVTGSGKTSVGHLLSVITGWKFADGDDFHTEENKRKMHSGIPLTDDDRTPWLDRLHGLLFDWHQGGQSGILACSALKESYRKILSAEIRDLRFVLLEVPREILEQRLHSRKDHFMNPELLDSQLATLEMPIDALRVPPTDSTEETVDLILRHLKA
jgi:gluconokinase